MVGFLSGDFGEQHPTGDLFRSVLQLINHDKFKVKIFSTSKRCIEVERDLIGDKKIEFISFENATDHQVARTIYDHKVFHLIDLNGFTAGARLMVLKLRPAPRQ